MLNLGKEFLYNAPVKVHFAGFESDTYRLGKQGWDLSMEQGRRANYDTYQMRIVMRLESAKLYAMTNTIEIEPWVLRGSPTEFMQALEGIYFTVQVIGNDIRFRVIPTMEPMMHKFEPVDHRPIRGDIEENLADFKFFKVINPSVKDIIVDPTQVPELLDLILKTQKPTMEELKKCEKSRQNMIDYGGEKILVKPNSVTHAQIISLA